MKSLSLNRILHVICIISCSIISCHIHAENSTNALTADSTKQVKHHTIIDELATPDPVTGATIIVEQSPEITKMLKPRREIQNNGSSKGYRIQIFSSNRGQEAREKAFRIEKEIIDKHPNLDVYVTYTAPFWKVRIGNCSTYEEAQHVRKFIIEEFPDYSTETNIVPSTIFVSE